ncbi:MAG: hypothetical protein ABSC05_37315 [Candidatus Solibacter sp.]|jgi:hypothetical protein
MDLSDEQLWETCLKLPTDFEACGRRKWPGRREARPDCATCCWFAEAFHLSNNVRSLAHWRRI